MNTDFGMMKNKNDVKYSNHTTRDDAPNHLREQFTTLFSTFLTRFKENQFLKEMEAGTLDPCKFGAFLVLDSYFCTNAASGLESAYNRLPKIHDFPDFPEGLAVMLKKILDVYKAYTNEFANVWHLHKHEAGNSTELYDNVVVPTEKMKDYADHIKFLGEEQHPLTMLIGIYVRFAVWDIVLGGMECSNANVYSKWINEHINARLTAEIDLSIENYWVGKYGWDDEIYGELITKLIGDECTIFEEAAI